jgi:GntR family transcriptional regulator
MAAKTKGRSAPKHLALRENLRKKFSKLSPDSPIPSALDLARIHKVSVMTVRQALVALQQQGLLYAIPGKGTFVADQRIAKKLVFTSFSQEVIERGMVPSSKVISATRQKLEDPDVAIDLQVDVGDPIYRIVRIRYADGFPLALEESLISADLMPGLLDQNLNNSLYETFKNVYEKPIVRAECIVSPITLNKVEAEYLDSDIKSPALKFIVVAYDARNRVIERCISIKRGDRYDFRYSISAEM